jgi:hypothetical protein
LHRPDRGKMGPQRPMVEENSQGADTTENIQRPIAWRTIIGRLSGHARRTHRNPPGFKIRDNLSQVNSARNGCGRTRDAQPPDAVKVRVFPSWCLHATPSLQR